MQKDRITVDIVIKDLEKIAYEKLCIQEEWRFTWIVPAVIFAVLIAVLWRLYAVSVLLLAFAVYQGIFFGRAYGAYRMQKRIIDDDLGRGDLSISLERLDHIAKETVWETHSHRNRWLRGHRVDHTKRITVFYFSSGRAWRIPETPRHYDWSAEYQISTEGLMNISLEGNEFFHISLQGHHEIAYAYPRKFFELGDGLEARETPLE